MRLLILLTAGSAALCAAAKLPGAGASSGLAGRALTNSSSALDLDRDIDGADDAVEPLEDWQDLEPDEEDADDHFGVGLMLNDNDREGVEGSPRTAAVSVDRSGVTQIVVGAARRLATADQLARVRQGVVCARLIVPARRLPRQRQDHLVQARPRPCCPSLTAQRPRHGQPVVLLGDQLDARLDQGPRGRAELEANVAG